MNTLIKSYLALFFSFFLITHAVATVYALPAFPGAEGFGSETVGGRGNGTVGSGQIIFVTNTNNSGAGSLRAALEASGPRIIVFKTGGIITLTSKINVTSPYVTVLGQTAPGNGILIRGATIRVNTHDVIVRGLRTRAGDDPTGIAYDNRDSINLETTLTGNEVYNVIFDHNSISWGVDENTSLWSDESLNDKIHDVTFSWNIISEGLYNSEHSKGIHSMGLLVGDHAKNISIHRNLFAHNNERNPLMKGGTKTEVINNIIYNWGSAGTRINDYEDTGNNFTNVVNNYYKSGPNSGNEKGISIDSRNIPAGPFAYIVGNSFNGTVPSNPWDSAYVDASMQHRSTGPAFPLSNVTVQEANTMYASVVNGAGALVPARDSIDSRVVQEVQTGTGGMVNSQNDVGGWPSFPTGMYPTDSDNDGMPDAWESSNGRNPSVADSAQISPRGYMWIEEYAHSLISQISSTPTPTHTPTPTFVPAPGDTNGDRSVNLADLSFLLGVFGKPVIGSGDINGDGTVNLSDLSILLANFGKSF